MSDRLDVRKTYKLYIGGKFPRSESGRSYEVTDSKADLSTRNVQDVTQALNMLMHGNDPQFADFRSGYARASSDAKVAATEARWREALAAAQPEGRTSTAPGSLEA